MGVAGSGKSTVGQRVADLLQVPFHEGDQFHPPMMLVKDADTLARWYFRLKREFAAAQAEGRAFENPVEETVLRWRS